MSSHFLVCLVQTLLHYPGRWSGHIAEDSCEDENKAVLMGSTSSSVYYPSPISAPDSSSSVLEEALPCSNENSADNFVQHDVGTAAIDYEEECGGLTLGIQLGYAEDFYNACGGRESLEGLSVHDVNERCIKPLINITSKQSFTEYLRSIHHPSLGPASLYISVSWKYEFMDLIDCLKLLLQDHEEWAKSYVWLDFFSHHNLNFISKIEFNEWKNLFATPVSIFKKVHLLHIPWNHSFVQEKDFEQTFLLSTINVVDTEKIARFGREIVQNRCEYEEDECTRFRMSLEAARLVELTANYEEAEQLYSQTLCSMRCSEQFGNNHYDTVVVMNDYALLLCNENLFGARRLEEAEKLLNECIEVLTKCLGTVHPDVIIVRSNLATVYEKQSKWGAARALHTSCLTAKISLIGPFHPLTILSKNNLGTFYVKSSKEISDHDRIDMAEHMFEDCIHVHKTLDTEEDQIRSTVYMANLASVYLQLGRKLNLAEPLLRDCLAQLRALLGNEHIDTLRAMYILAVYYFDTDKLDDAEQLFVEILDVAVSIFTQSHRLFFNTMRCYSLVLGRQNKHEKALNLSIDCYERCLTTFGPDDEDTLISIKTTASMYAFLGEYEESERLLLTCIEKKMGSKKSNDILVLECILDLVKIYEKMGLILKAEEMVRQCLHATLEECGVLHRLTLEVRHVFAGLLVKAGRHDESESVYLACLEGRKWVLGETHSDTVATMNDLALLYMDQNRCDESEELLLSCLSHADPVKKLTYMSNLGVLYCRMEKYAEAQPLLADCVEKRKILYGDDHSSTVFSREILSYIGAKLCLPLPEVEVLAAEDSSDLEEAYPPKLRSPCSPNVTSGRPSFESPRVQKHLQKFPSQHLDDDHKSDNSTSFAETRAVGL